MFSLRAHAQQRRSKRNSTAGFAMRVLGKTMASSEAVPITQFHSRTIQLNTISMEEVGSVPWSSHVSILPKKGLVLVNHHVNSQQGQSQSVLPYNWKVLITDACLSGLGGAFQPLTVQETWSREEAKLINISVFCSNFSKFYQLLEA